MEGIIHENNGEGHTDPWGVEWVKESRFNQILKSPLEDASEEEILSYEFPYKQIEQLLTNMEKVLPYSKEIFDVGKKKDLWIAYHSCGAIRPIIPDLIEIGLDVLNPIQSNCPGMDPYELKEEFGGELAFMGGLDTQYLVPNGPSEEVYKETLNLIEGMTVDGGGYILAAGVSSEEIYDRAADVRNRSEK